MFSMAGATLFLPFLQMLPTQILLNNLLYDASQVSIPTDSVDDRLLRSPKRWRTDLVRKFMVTTGWFVESMLTQTLVIFIIRTPGNPLLSRPGRGLMITVLAAAVIATTLPFSIVGHWFGFVPLSPALILVIAVLTLTYLGLVEIVKRWFYARYSLV